MRFGHKTASRQVAHCMSLRFGYVLCMHTPPIGRIDIWRRIDNPCIWNEHGR